jgi:chemotaxis protein CheC
MKNQTENPIEVTCELNNLGKQTTNTDEVADLGILLELGSIGAGHAATSLSDVLQQQVLIEIPKIHKIPPITLYERYKDKDQVPTTAIYMKLADSECDILLMFELTEAKKIAAIMTMTPSIEELDPAMEESAIQELANILIGSFLTAISDFTGLKLMPSTPLRVVDTLGTIMDNFIVKQSMLSEQALVFDTHFKRSSDDANSMLMLFPSPELLEVLVKKSKEQMGI